jgi:8-oxo-dGTP pyrophosphatase MutT (NUDIX family)
MNDLQLNSLRALLAQFASKATFTDAADSAQRVLAFINGEARPWSRATLAGHLTASAWVLDRSGTHAALIHHRKLNRWLQPGGHIDDADASWRAAALRETAEETGLLHFVDFEQSDALFDVDVHSIPARKDEPGHFHYDLRFLFVADVDATVDDALTINAEESHDCRWFALTALENDAALEASLRRMVELSIRRISNK